MARPDDSDLMSRAALANMAGISSTTLRNWSNREDQPLEVEQSATGTRLYSWAALLRFCDRHPDLHGVAAVRARRRKTDAGQDGVDAVGDATLRTALAEMRRALDSSLAAIARATEVATETAASHAETVAALQQAIRSYEVAAIVDQSE